MLVMVTCSKQPQNGLFWGLSHFFLVSPKYRKYIYTIQKLSPKLLKLGR